MDKFLTAIGTVVVGVLVFVGVSLLMAYPTLWMVNYLFTSSVILSLFGAVQLTFWKAFWLNYFCASLFKSAASTK